MDKRIKRNICEYHVWKLIKNQSAILLHVTLFGRHISQNHKIYNFVGLMKGVKPWDPQRCEIRMLPNTPLWPIWQHYGIFNAVTHVFTMLWNFRPDGEESDAHIHNFSDISTLKCAMPGDRLSLPNTHTHKKEKKKKRIFLRIEWHISPSVNMVTKCAINKYTFLYFVSKKKKKEKKCQSTNCNSLYIYMWTISTYEKIACYLLAARLMGCIFYHLKEGWWKVLVDKG